MPEASAAIAIAPLPAHYALPSRARWALRISTGLLFLAGYMALGAVQSYGSLPVIVAMIVLILTPFGERLDAAVPLYRIITRAVTIMCFCLIPVALLFLDLLDAVVALVVYIQFHTMLHQKEEKSYYHIFLMAFFLLLAACNQAPEASISLVLALFLAATIWSFFSLRVAFDAYASQTKVRADIVRFGEEPTKVAHDDRDPFGLSIVGYIVIISFLSFGITLAIFFLTPRVEAGLLGRANVPITRTGVPETVQLSSGTTILEDLTPVLRAEFPDEPEGRVTVSPLYWRMTTLARFNGTGWRHAALSSTGENAREGSGHDDFQPESMVVSRRTKENTRGVRQVVYMDNVPTQGMPALDLVQKITLTGNARGTRIAWEGSNDFTVTLARSGSRQMRYEVVSEVDEPTPDELRAVTGNFDLSPEDLVLLTDHFLGEDSLATVRALTAGAETFYDQVKALENYLSGPDFVYSLTVPSLPPNNAIDAFLNNTRTGHCELFATALALMVRSLGIPARVVSGFKGGDYDENDGGYIIRQSMAHLWVEVYFPGQGWVRFDPSPQSAADQNPGLINQIRMTASLYALKARMFWFGDVVGFQGFRVLDLNELRFRFFGEVRSLQNRVADAAANGLLTRVVSGAGLTMALLVLTMWIIYRVFTDAFAARRSRWGHYTLTRDQTQAAALYRKLRKKLARCGVEIRDKTVEELLDDIEGLDWPDKAEAVQLLHAYNEVRFGGRPLGNAYLARLRRSLRALRPKRAASSQSS